MLITAIVLRPQVMGSNPASGDAGNKSTTEPTPVSVSYATRYGSLSRRGLNHQQAALSLSFSRCCVTAGMNNF